MKLISIGKLKIDNFHYKRLDEKGITIEVNIPLKNNIIFTTIEVNSLSGDLYIVNNNFKITSKDKIGRFICYNSFILEHGKENIIKLYFTLYYTDIFFGNIPKVSFDIEYKIDINISGNCCIFPLNWFIKEKRGKINLIKLLKKHLK